jgi:predicted dehydrogenase
MCEKPMAKSTSEAQEMIAAAERNNKKLTIGYQNRFRSDSQYLHKVTQRGDLGDIYFGKAQAIRRRAVPTWGDGLRLNGEDFSKYESARTGKAVYFN